MVAVNILPTELFPPVLAIRSQAYDVDFLMVPLVTCTIVAGAVSFLYVGWLAATVTLRRRAVERDVLTQLSAVLGQDVPLPEGLRAAAVSERPPVRQRLLQIAEATARGMPLPAALASAYPKCSGMTRSVIAAGYAAQQTSRGVALAEHTLAEREKQELRLERGTMVYVGAILFFTVGIITMLMIVVVPKFKEIFVDFDVQLPRVTVILIAWSNTLARWGAVLLAAMLLTAMLAAHLRTRPRRPDAPRWTTAVADALRWGLPIFGRMEQSQGLALALQTMRIAVSAGMPLGEAAGLAGDLDVNVRLRDRIRHFADLLRAGCNAGEAARRSALGPMTVLAFSAGARTGDMAAALRYAGEYHESLLGRWSTTLRQFAWPLCTLVLAGVVALVVLAMFMPLVTLISSASTW